MPVRRCRRTAVWLVVAGLSLGFGVAPAQPRPETLAACAACHGPAGNSQTALVPSLAGQPKLFLENQLVLVREGLREIAVMKDVVAGLKDDEIVALAAYYAAQQVVPRPAPLQGERFRAGAELSRRMLCGTCHLPGYTGQQQVPRLAGQDEGYLLRAMRQFRDQPGPGRDTIMAASLYGLKDDDLVNLAHYLAQAKP
jgi:cytochrome c553